MTSPLPRVRSTNWAIRAWITLCLTLIFNKRACFNQLLPWIISGEWRIRTSESFCYLIYSQTPLATWVTHHSFWIVANSLASLNWFKDTNQLATEPTIGLEPMTCRLQGGRSANWAMSAQWITPFAHLIIAVEAFLSRYFLNFVTAWFRRHRITATRQDYTTRIFFGNKLVKNIITAQIGENRGRSPVPILY